MELYSQYSYNPAFCAFRKIVAETLRRYLTHSSLTSNTTLCITKYLEISIVDKVDLSISNDFLETINLNELLIRADGTLQPNYKVIEELAKKYIIDSAAKAETKWDTLNREMIHDYDEHKFPNTIFEPYIKWKKSEISFNEINLEQIDRMSEEADRLQELYDAQYPHAHEIHDTFIVDDPWQFTRGYGDDKRMVAYLEYISDQLADLRIRNSF